jgi:S-adenosylmethionine uptake transporter
MPDNLRGAFLMMVSMAAFVLSDTCFKATGGQLPLFQLLTLRSIITTIVFWALARRMNGLVFDLPARDWGLIALRSLAEVATGWFFLTALLNMPLANLTAILQVLPLTVTLGAVLFFREPVGRRRMAAIAVGFCGMLLIVRPGTEGFGLYTLSALAAVACVTLRDLVTRRMPAHIPSLTVTFTTSAAVLISAALASLFTPWQPVDAGLAALIAGSAMFITVGYLSSVLVMRVGDVSFIAPFRYTGLLWALLLGWFVFGDWPDGLTMIGAGLVVATGLFTLYRERATLSR